MATTAGQSEVSGTEGTDGTLHPPLAPDTSMLSVTGLRMIRPPGIVMMTVITLGAILPPAGLGAAPPLPGGHAALPLLGAQGVTETDVILHFW